MPIILKVMRATSPQPVLVGAAFDAVLEFERFPPDEPDHPTTVKLWSDSMYAVLPPTVPISMPAGKNDLALPVKMTLSGPRGPAFVRILGQCDEIHSLVVEAK